MSNLRDRYERCPKCKGIYIQQDRITKELYCLNKICNNRWEQILKEPITNPYLRASRG